MIVVEPRGLGLVPWEKVSTWLIMGITKFFQFFIIGESFVLFEEKNVEINIIVCLLMIYDSKHKQLFCENQTKRLFGIDLEIRNFSFEKNRKRNKK